MCLSLLSTKSVDILKEENLNNFRNLKSMDKPKMTLTARRIYGRIYLKPGCDKSHALMSLLSNSKGPRSTIDTNELSLVSKMGFDIDIVGDVKEFKQEIKRLNSDKETFQIDTE